MFKINHAPTFTAPAHLSVPGQDDKVTVTIEFKHLDQDAVHAFWAGLSDKTTAQALGEIIVGWTGFDLPYSADALAQLLKRYPVAGKELFASYRDNFLEQRTKN